MDGRDSERYVIASISCGRDHTLALLDDGRVFGWGGDGSGRMPANTAEYCSTSKSDGRAVELSPRHKLTSIAAGYGISLGVTTTNRVAVWGSNAAGIGGRRESIALATPQLLTDIDGIRAVVAGEYLFGAIDAAGRIYITQTNDGRVRLVSLDGTITTIASGTLDHPAGIAPGSQGKVYVTEAGFGIPRIRLLTPQN